ncbi:hypothetical protein [Telmatospirillum siberiense]|uniref:hypothetical protein n=1 Tax=Telmatospirillum siberiense TaxID=382514 RepID=UPI0011AECC06|nr:hypothetical protein [Telmatospirillum siberiense]
MPVNPAGVFVTIVGILRLRRLFPPPAGRASQSLRPAVFLLSACLLALCPEGRLFAQEANEPCAVSDDLAIVNYPLDHVYARLQAKAPLKILLVGSTSSTGSPAWAGKGLAVAFRAYPRLLEGELAGLMPSLRASVTDKTAAGLTAPMVVAQLEANLAQNRPDLVIWETGTTDAVRRLDVNVFGETLTDGLRKIHERGIDVMLVDIQYSPQTDSIYDFQPYLDYLWRVGEAEDANILHRFGIMRYYVDQGRFDPAATTAAEQMKNANFVHACLARQLARMILTAAQQQP